MAFCGKKNRGCAVCFVSIFCLLLFIYLFIVIVVPRILISVKFTHQQMHSLLKLIKI